MLRQLELKIPPPLVALLGVVLMYFLALWTPDITLNRWFKIITAIVVAGFGFYVSVAGIIAFKKAKTTVNPTTPKKSSSIVTTGIYQLTRNPMYLGSLLLLVAWALYLANMFSLVVPVMFILYINKFQIMPEERILEDLFASDYLSYKAKVRRWL